MMPPFPICYVLMRTDLDSMNGGRCSAQSHHAGTIMAKLLWHKVVQDLGSFEPNESELANATPLLRMFLEWDASAGGFGTTIVLGVTEKQLLGVIQLAQSISPFVAPVFAGLVHDPSYAIRDGDTTFTLPVTTGGFIFGEKDFLAALMRQFDLFGAPPR